MGGFAPIAELFATLGLDDTLFNQRLAAAEGKLIAAGEAMRLPITRINSLMDTLGDNEGISRLSDQFDALRATGLSAHEALAVISKDEARVDAENAALRAEYNRLDTASVREQLAIRKASATERAQQELQAEQIVAADRAQYSAVWKGLLAGDDAAQKELAAEYVATWGSLLRAREFDESLSATKRAAQEREATAIMGEMDRSYVALWAGLLAERDAATAASISIEETAIAQRNAFLAEQLAVAESMYVEEKAVAIEQAKQVALARAQYTQLWKDLLAQEDAAQKSLVAEYTATWRSLLRAREAEEALSSAKRVAQEKEALSIMAERDREYVALWVRLLAERNTATLASLQVEEEATTARTAILAEQLAVAESMFIAEQEVEAELAIQTAATKVTLLNGYLSALRTAYAQQIEMEESLAAKRAITQGSYALGGYGAGRMAGLLGSVSPAVVGVAAGAFAGFELVKWTKDAADAARATSNLSTELGLTFTQTRQLQEAAEIAGVKLNTLEQASWHLAQAVDSGNAAGDRLSKRLGEIGVQGTNSGELMMSFLNVLSKIPDQTQRIALAHEVMGRASYQIIPLISNYQQLMDLVTRMGPVIGEEQRKQLEDTARSVSSLSVEWERLKQTLSLAIGIPVVSWLSGIANAAMSPSFKNLGLLGLAMSTNNKGLLAGIGPGGTAPTHTKTLNDLIAEEQGKANVDAARDYKLNKTPTLEGLKASLEEAKSIEKETDQALSRTMDALGPQERGTMQTRYDQAVADVKTYTAQIKAMEHDTANNRYKLEAEQIASATRHNRDLLELELAQAEQKHRVTLDSIDRETELKRRINDSELAETEAGIKGKLGAVRSEAPSNQKEIETKLLSDLDHARQQAKIKDVEYTARGEEEKRKILEENAKDWQRAAAHYAEEDREFDKRVTEAKREQHNDEIRARMSGDKAAADSAIRNLELVRQNNKFLADQQLITQTERIARDKRTDDQEYATRKKAINLELADLQEMEGKVEGIDIHAATRKQQLLNELQAIKDEQAKRNQGYLQEEAKGLDSIAQAINAQVVAQRQLIAESKGANDRGIQLENERIKTWALAQQTRGLAGDYADFIKAGVSGIKSLNSGMADAIVESKSFHDAWQTAIKGLGKSLIEILLLSVEKVGASWVITQTLGAKAAAAMGLAATGAAAKTAAAGATELSAVATVATGTASAVLGVSMAMASVAVKIAQLQAISEIVDYSAIGGAAAAAAEASIPFIGPAAAVAAGMEMLGAIQGAFLPIVGISGATTFEQGGGVPHDMFAMVHGGETMISSDLTVQLKRALGGGGSGSSGDHFDFRGATFGPGLTQSGVDHMFQQAIGKVRRAGGGLKTKTGKF